jgi:hypothetical protein
VTLNLVELLKEQCHEINDTKNRRPVENQKKNLLSQIVQNYNSITMTFVQIEGKFILGKANGSGSNVKFCILNLMK